MGRTVENSKMEISGGPVQDRKASDVLTASMEVGSAVQYGNAIPNAAPEALPPRKEVFRVTKECTVVLGGIKQRFYEGKEIDTLNYDIKMLKRQGVRLEPVKDEE